MLRTNTSAACVVLCLLYSSISSSQSLAPPPTMAKSLSLSCSAAPPILRVQSHSCCFSSCSVKGRADDLTQGSICKSIPGGAPDNRSPTTEASIKQMDEKDTVRPLVTFS
ncbi:uncharacterized protein LOC108715328 isoform X1 [Xenopus laevis]|uniref:Uncharacterized protein LOC108715328 isoform X1 n=1 Tax=Xenopus laevis TaxID=8355 RepID=A0A8J1KJV5_XENLA|nr:uncharacterized protein LOC108715328 isoform X1 [Xenopus laevis]